MTDDTVRNLWIVVQMGAALTRIEPVRSGPASDVFLVIAGDTRAYFKACRGPAAHEPALLAALHDLAPGLGPEIIGVDMARGWTLMADGGPPVREQIRADGDRERSARMMRHYAQTQQALIPHVRKLLALGVPDRRLERLPELYEALIAEPGWLMVGHPGGVSEDDLARLRAFDVGALCDQLGALGLPDTLHHDDFHTANVVANGEHYRIVDWGESFIAHPLLGALIPLRDAKYTLAYDAPALERMTAAFLAMWADYAPLADLRAALGSAYRLAALSRALTWQACLAVAGDAARAADGDTVPYWLLTCVNNTPLEA